MAQNDFAPRVSFDKPENTMNFSKGFDTKAGAIGEGLGALGKDIASGILVADTAVKMRVDEEVRSAVEDANHAFYGFQSDPKKSDQEVPPELMLRLRKLERMKTGVDQGRIPDTHYWQVLHKESKDIRSRYSGYANEIDSAFAQLTGTTPARAIIREMEAAENAARQASASDDKRNAAFLDAYIKSGNGRPDLIMRASQPGAHSDAKFMAQVRQQWGQEAAFRQDIGRRIELHTLESKERDFNIDNTSATFNEYVMTQYQSLISGSADYQTLMKLSERARLEAANGGSVTKGTEETIRNLVSALRQRTEQIKNDAINRFNVRPDDRSPTLLSRIDKQRGETFKFLDDSIGRIEKNLIDENFGSLALNTTLVKSFDARNTAELTKSAATASSLARLEERLGPEAARRIFMSPEGARALNEVAQFASAKSAARVADKEVASLTEEMRNMQIRGEMTGEASRGLFDKTMAILNSKSVDPGTYMSFADALVGPANSEFFSTLPEDKRSEAYRIITSPGVFKMMSEYATSTGRSDVLDNYKGFTFNALAQLGRTSVDTINNLNLSSSTVSANYNPNTRRFELKKHESTATTGLGRWVAGGLDKLTGDAKSATQAISEINGILSSLDALAQSTGTKFSSDAPAVLRAMGFNPDIVKQGNVIDRLNSATRVTTGDKLQGRLPEPMKLGGPKPYDGFFDTVPQANEGSSGVTVDERPQAELSAAPNDSIRATLMETFGLSVDNADKIIGAVDMLTGLPSFSEALKNGDKGALATTLAGVVVPFVPKGLAGKGTKVAGEIVDQVGKAANLNVDTFKQTLGRLPDRISSLSAEIDTVIKDVPRIIKTSISKMEPDDYIALSNLKDDFKFYEKQVALYKKFLEKADMKNSFDADMYAKYEERLGQMEQRMLQAVSKAEELRDTLGPKGQ